MMLMADPRTHPQDAYHHFCICHVASNLNTHVKNVEMNKLSIAITYQIKRELVGCKAQSSYDQ